MAARSTSRLPVDPDPLLIHLGAGLEVTPGILKAAIHHRIALKERLADFPCSHDGTECAWHEQLARRNSLDLSLLERALAQRTDPRRAVIAGQTYFQPCSHCQGQLTWFTYPQGRAGEWRCAGCACAWTIDFTPIDAGPDCPVPAGGR